jgi:nitroreductase
MNITTAIQQRHACRAFLDKPVPDEVVRQILETARWAPSGVNSQPWKVAVVRGQHKQAITESLIDVRDAGAEPNPDYQYYPGSWFEPYKTRRKTCGLALYGALQIERGETEKQKQAWYNNYRFFGAPLGLFVFIDGELAQGSWLDLGMFIQNIMLAALDHGLATCPQAALADYPDIIRQQLDWPAGDKLACGLSLGYPDTDHPVNRFRLEREPVDAFTRFYE